MNLIFTSRQVPVTAAPTTVPTQTPTIAPTTQTPTIAPTIHRTTTPTSSPTASLTSWTPTTLSSAIPSSQMTTTPTWTPTALLNDIGTFPPVETPNAICYVCQGLSDFRISNPDVVLDITFLSVGFTEATCKVIEDAGLAGQLTTDNCNNLGSFVTNLADDCDCAQIVVRLLFSFFLYTRNFFS
jgi:hypothetical protein